MWIDSIADWVIKNEVLDDNKIEFELNSVKGIVENLLIDKNNYFNKKISEYLIENKLKFSKKITLTDEKKLLLYEDVINIDFSRCEILKSVNLNDWLIKVILTNIIKDTYWIDNSSFHEVHFWKNENTFCIFKYKNEVKRYKSFSEDTMKSIYDKFSENIDFLDIIESRINNDFDFDKYSELELKNFYEWWYKLKIINIIKDEFYNFLPSLLIENIDNEVIVWMVQYFYRKNFNDINDLWLSKLNNLLFNNISNEITQWSKEKRQAVEIVLKKFIRFNSNEIIKSSWLNSKLANDIFYGEIKNIIDFIDRHPVFSKQKPTHEFENDSQYIKMLILKHSFSKWKEILFDYSKEKLWVEMDIWLINSILSNNVLSKWVWSLSFELSKLIFKYLIDSSKDYTWIKIKKWFEVFFDNFDWKIDKNWIKKQFFNPVVLKDWWIDTSWWFWRNFVWEFDNMLSRENLAMHNFNLSNSEYITHHVNLINDTLKGFALRSINSDNSISEWKFIVFHLIKEFSNILITKK